MSFRKASIGPWHLLGRNGQDCDFVRDLQDERVGPMSLAMSPFRHAGLPRLAIVDVAQGEVHVQARWGVSLRHLLTHRATGEMPLDVDALADLVHQLADALHHAHQHEVTHGSLQPDVLAISVDGHLTVWGWADPEWARATAPYASPQRQRGHIARPSDDLFAMAVIAVQAWSGRPVPTRGLQAWAEPTLRGVPKPMQQALLAALDDDPLARPSARQVIEAARGYPASDMLANTGRHLVAGYGVPVGRAAFPGRPDTARRSVPQPPPRAPAEATITVDDASDPFGATAAPQVPMFHLASLLAGVLLGVLIAIVLVVVS